MLLLEALNLHAPLKAKYLRTNHSRFISIYLSKAIMHREGRRGEGYDKNEMLLDIGVGKVGSVLDVQPFFLETCIYAMTRHHAESNNILFNDTTAFFVGEIEQ